MKNERNIGHAIFYFWMFFLSITTFLLVLLYPLIHYQFNVFFYFTYYFSWWSTQFIMLWMYHCIFMLFYLYQRKCQKIVLSLFWQLYLVFCAFSVLIFYTSGMIEAAVDHKVVNPGLDNQVIYWFYTVVTHWIIPIAVILYYYFTYPHNLIIWKDFYRNTIWKFSFHPLLYVGYIAVRQAILLNIPINDNLYQYANASNTYYVPYFFLDFHNPGYYFLYLLAVMLIFLAIIYLLIYLYNIIVQSKIFKKIKKSPKHN